MKNNLGAYKIVVEVMKKLHGPKIALPVFAITSYALIKPIELLVTKVVKKIKKSESLESPTEYCFTSNGQYDSLCFSNGERFTVLVTADNAVVIEKKDDDNNPYVVSYDYLKTVSTFA